ncbi:hypothetical protein ACMDCR_09135 [Labrys okinawensis]|uniref:hypothetical protein n=1 Tax=Labrys okinawensis TaxID=346911 RepID=UPI0039BC4528
MAGLVEDPREVRGKKGIALGPTANQISIRQVLANFGAAFATIANAVENGEFALWVGSGMFRFAPNRSNLIGRAFEKPEEPHAGGGETGSRVANARTAN